MASSEDRTMNGHFAVEAVLVPTDCRFSARAALSPPSVSKSRRDFADSGVIVPSHASWWWRIQTSIDSHFSFSVPFTVTFSRDVTKCVRSDHGLHDLRDPDFAIRPCPSLCRLRGLNI